ncbi:MAG: thioredoxin domain-containing protein [Pseudomonadota bacterium]
MTGANKGTLRVAWGAAMTSKILFMLVCLAAVLGFQNRDFIRQSLFGPDLTFVAWPADDRFRMIEGAGLSAAVDLLTVGVDRPEPVAVDVCTTLPRDPSGETVQISAFHDYYCPNCREVLLALEDIAEADGVALTVFDWPIFGLASEQAARAAHAAGLQDARPAFQSRMLGTTFLPTERYLNDLSQSLGLDPAQFRSDMRAPSADAEIAATRALANTLGLRGTPSVIIGGTVIEGAVTEAKLRAVIAAERNVSPPGC